MRSEGITFIAEIGLNHNGNFGLLYELIKQAAMSGADIAKFQLGWRSGEDEINNLGFEEIELIKKISAYYEIEPMFSIFNHDALKLITQFEFESFKIASRTVREEPQLVEDIISKGKRTYISLGMWDLDEKPFSARENVCYLWCQSDYPAYPWLIKGMPKDFASAEIIGYSDHSVGIEVPLMAIMRGALVIEKHFTLDKSDTTIRDHALSATPVEFRQLVDLGRSIKRNLEIGV